MTRANFCFRNISVAPAESGLGAGLRVSASRGGGAAPVTGGGRWHWPRCVLFLRLGCTPASISPLPIFQACLPLSVVHLLLFARAPHTHPGMPEPGARRWAPPAPVPVFEPRGEALSARLLTE